MIWKFIIGEKAATATAAATGTHIVFIWQIGRWRIHKDRLKLKVASLNSDVELKSGVIIMLITLTHKEEFSTIYVCVHILLCIHCHALSLSHSFFQPNLSIAWLYFPFRFSICHRHTLWNDVIRHLLNSILIWWTKFSCILFLVMYFVCVCKALTMMKNAILIISYHFKWFIRC